MNKRFKPQYLPYNDDAEALVESLAAELQLTLKDKTGAKHRTILSSFLYCVQEAGVGALLDWSGGTTSQDTTGVSFFPATGAATAAGAATGVTVVLGTDTTTADAATLAIVLETTVCVTSCVTLGSAGFMVSAVAFDGF